MAGKENKTAKVEKAVQPSSGQGGPTAKGWAGLMVLFTLIGMFGFFYMYASHGWQWPDFAAMASFGKVIYSDRRSVPCSPQGGRRRYVGSSQAE